MKRIVWLGVCALLLAAIPGFAASVSLDDLFAAGPQANPETVGTPRDPGARAAEMRDLHQRLAARQVEGGLRHGMEVRLSNAERKSIDQPSDRNGKYLVGVAKSVGVTVDFTPVQRGAREVNLAAGSAKALADGGFVWTTAISSPGATALRVHLSGVDLPEGGELYVYNSDGQAFGPYKGRGPLGDGELYTNTVFGERLVLQLFQPGGAERLPSPLRIAGVGVMGKRFAIPHYGPEGVFDPNNLDALAKASNLCSNNANCVVNAACQSSTAVNDAKDAVATILFQSGASFYICTGGLIADTVTTSVIPYFLTAHHCISSSGEASSVETYFDYQTTCSNPNCTQPYNNTGETVGSTIKATNSSSDYSLLQLSSAPTTPDGVATYLGWLSSPVANTNNYGLFRISHPKGSPQAYTEGVVDTGKPTCRTLPRGSFIYSRDTVGATEGGSSGSPVVNSAGQIVGQLYGACGTNLNDVCDAQSNGTVDGAFAATYPNVAAFLNPGSGGGCGAAGSSCTSNSQCCSNSCKGKPGTQTCK
ncbi:MAG TPA: serine protease [Thermoanaerobaculia bacterium]|jgi:S1-C subfamily serine protease|nr:serine protease [Thermoanaerobaculia bacterium]